MRPRNVSAKYSGGPKAQRGCAENRGEKHQPHEPESSGNEGAQSRDSQSRAGAPLTGHLITIETGNHGSRLARNVDQNGSGGAAVHRAIVYSRQHDDRCGGSHFERQRQQQSDGGDRTQTGKHADEGPDKYAGEAEK